MDKLIELHNEIVGPNNASNFTTNVYGNRGFIVDYWKEERCESWILLPGENLWPSWVRGVLYIVFMFYLFIGIAIISDIFMGSIEVITSKKRTITRYDPITKEARTKEVLVWNETVANLSLMALGSSAPEILLAFVEQLGLLLSGKGDDLDAGGLGTFTIIGSAAFNLLVITGICIMSPETGTTKKIEQFGVFCTTAIWSVFAYVWILIVLEYSSPNVVEVWEAVVTFLFFPLLILHAWAQDNNWWCIGAKTPFMTKLLTSQKKKGQVPMYHTNGSNENVNNHVENNNDKGDVEKQAEQAEKPKSKWAALRAEPEEAAKADEGAPKANPWVKLLPAEEGEGGEEHTSGPTTALARSRFRHAVLSSMMGSKRVTPKIITSAQSRPSKLAPKIATLVEVLREARRKETELARLSQIKGFFYFKQKMYNIMHDKKELLIDVVYKPNPTYKPLAPEDKTKDVDAARLQAYLTSQPVNTGDASVPEPVAPEEKALLEDTTGSGEDITALIQDFQSTFKDANFCHYSTRDGTAKKNLDYEPVSGVLQFTDQETVQQIVIPILHRGDADVRQEEFNLILENPSKDTDLGDHSICTVTILDMSNHGSFAMDCTRYHSDPDPGEISIGVKREGGSDGAVAISYKTIDATAVGGLNGNDGSDYIKTMGTLWFRHGETYKNIDVVVNPNAANHSTLIVALQKPLLGASLGEDCAMVITICKTEGCRESRDEALLAEIAGNYDEEDTPLKEAYLEQFTNALTMGGEVDEDGNEEETSIGDLVMHFISLFWKVLFSLVPPRFCGSGYPAFLVSLIFIGILTAVVEQVASLLGCVWNMKSSVAGITLVALGTSLPDTFASRSAAVHDDSADAAIGNVTGSNSVNVFLGLGLPWLLAVIWKGIDGSGEFKVGTNNLEFSVALFVLLACFAILTLIVRRAALGGELGGSACVKYSTGSVCLGLWLCYVVLASLKAYGIIFPSVT